MIFLEVHTHRWVATGARHHDCLVYACTICGDRAIQETEYRENPPAGDAIPSIDSQGGAGG